MLKLLFLIFSILHFNFENSIPKFKEYEITYYSKNDNQNNLDSSKIIITKNFIVQKDFSNNQNKLYNSIVYDVNKNKEYFTNDLTLTILVKDSFTKFEDTSNVQTAFNKIINNIKCDKYIYIDSIQNFAGKINKFIIENWYSQKDFLPKKITEKNIGMGFKKGKILLESNVKTISDLNINTEFIYTKIIELKKSNYKYEIPQNYKLLPYNFQNVKNVIQSIGRNNNPYKEHLQDQ